jgi:septum site-determining protein MinC
MTMREYVVFKGSRNGLKLVFDESAEFTVVLEQLKAKLESAINFFTMGAMVQVPVTSRVLTVSQQKELEGILAAYGLVYQQSLEVEEAMPNLQQERLQDVAEIEPLVVAKTVRGGQEIIYKGTVIIMGDVNPGAEVIAGGDILIEGTCRGVVHAGAYGNMEATITANRLLATQIRIAGLIARAPDYLEQPNRVERARLKNGCVVIEPVNAQEGTHG